MSSVTIETYARIGFLAGTAATIPAVQQGSSLLAALVIGPLVGMLTGIAYGMLRARVAR